jgi:heme exporter protein D
MNWSSASEFFNMGGYGLYVWGSYGVTLILLGAEVLALFMRKRSVEKSESSPQLETRDPKLETVL